MRRLTSSVVLLTALCVAGSCKNEGPTNVLVVAPAGPLTFASLNLTQQLGAVVVDPNGAPVSGETIAWSSSSSLVATVDSTGLVRSKGNGTATITVTAGPLQRTVAVTVAQVAALDSKAAGDSQLANQGQQLATMLSVKVTDAGGAPMAGITVTFAAFSGGGSVFPASVLTGSSGLASTSWTLGQASTLQTATASAGTLAPLTFSANGIPAPAAGFQITVVNVGPPLSAAAQAAFDAAAAKWQSIITGDLSNISNFSVTTNGPCPAINQAVTVDDVLILARVDAIDGPGGVLGQAGPCWIRSSNLLTIMGIMTFDSADVDALAANGSLSSVILHEMGHVLGFGTLWDPTLVDCQQNRSTVATPVDTYYNCARGLAVFDSIGGTSYTGGNRVPLENCVGISQPCGSGTQNSHWRELVFFNELMTGYLNSGTANPLSVLTAASMQDLGYTVNLSAADAYTRTFTSPPAPGVSAESQRINLGDDVLRVPIYVWGVSGPVRVIRPR